MPASPDIFSDRRKDFLPQIESFRGVAACVVAVNHILLALEHPNPTWEWRFLKQLFNGGGAVCIFFVLSGFVLGLSLDARRNNTPFFDYIQFVTRRLFRLYPAYLASLVLILIYVVWWHQPTVYPAASPWFNQWYQALPTWSQARDILTFKDISLNNIAWTLRSELICSCLLPFLHFINRRIGLLYNCGVLFLLIAVSHFVSAQFVGNLYFFFLGLMVPAVNRHPWFAKTSPPILFYLAFLVCYIGVIQSGRDDWAAYSVLRVLPGFAAFGLVCLVASERQSTIHKSLGSELARFYGKISYSFYLLHFFVLYIVTTNLLKICSSDTITSQNYLFTGYLAAATFLITTPLAWISWRFIELPSTKIAKWLFNKNVFNKPA